MVNVPPLCCSSSGRIHLFWCVSTGRSMDPVSVGAMRRCRVPMWHLVLLGHSSSLACVRRVLDSNPVRRVTSPDTNTSREMVCSSAAVLGEAHNLAFPASHS